MAVLITYFVHGTTTDNENGIATGWNPGELSDIGRKQSADLKNMIKEKKFDTVFCSDLKRAVDSAELTFGGEVDIIKDRRLRECNYGDFNGDASNKVGSMTLERINEPFPNGESYKDVEKRIIDFLQFLLDEHDEKHTAIVAHRAPQLALDVILKKKTWKEAFEEGWRNTKEWKPGWDYELSFKSL